MSAMPLRVLMITGRADPGGGPEHLYQLAAVLAKNCEVFIAAPNETPFWGRYVDLVGAKRVFEIPHRQFSRVCLQEMTNWCREQEIEIVHSHGRAAGSYSRLLPKSAAEICIHTPHGSLQLKSTRDLAYWIAEVLLARRTDSTIAVSASESEQLRRRLLLNGHLCVIPNGVRIPVSTVDASNLEAARLRIVHVTRYVEQKNSGMVLDVLEELGRKSALERFQVDMLGDGPGRKDLEVEAARRGLDKAMSFHGTQNSIAPFLLKGFCLLTTSRWEGMPLAVLEALAHGLPVLASDTPGNNDVVNSDLGGLFPLDNASSAADSLIALAADPESWKQMSRAAASAAKGKYSIERMGNDTFALYEQLSGARKTVIRRAA